MNNLQWKIQALKNKLGSNADAKPEKEKYFDERISSLMTFKKKWVMPEEEKVQFTEEEKEKKR